MALRIKRSEKILKCVAKLKTLFSMVTLFIICKFFTQTVVTYDLNGQIGSKGSLPVLQKMKLHVGFFVLAEGAKYL
jgi:hypothetical protein